MARGLWRRYVPEAALHKAGTPRPAFLVAVGGLTASASLLAAYAGLSALYAAAILAGLAFGAH